MHCVLYFEQLMCLWPCGFPPGHLGAAEHIALVGKQQEPESRCCFWRKALYEQYNSEDRKTFKTSRERMKSPV